MFTICGPVPRLGLVLLWLGIPANFLPALAGPVPCAMVFAGVKPASDQQALADFVSALLRGAGYDVDPINWEALHRAEGLDTNTLDLLVVTDGRALPAAAADPILRWLRSGGDLVALGLPLWEAATFEVGGRWMSRSEHDAVLAAQVPQRILEDFDGGDLRAWRRSSDRSENRVRHELASSERGRALHVVIDQVTGWETYQAPAFAEAFAPGHTLTCFRAKGGERTSQLSLEWTERDGSRWIAVVDLTNAWRGYALPPVAFKAWEPRNGRGGSGDRFNPANAVRFTVGLAYSHTAIEAGPLEYWLDDLGTASSPFGTNAPPLDFEPPRLESLCPGYQFFPIHGEIRVRPCHEKAALEEWEWVSNAAELAFAPALALRGIHPRPRGIGFNQDRPWRWEPLLGAYAKNGERGRLLTGQADYRGALGVLLVNVKPPYFGSVWAGFTPAEAGFYRQPLVTNALAQVFKRMRRGVFLVEAGTEQYASLAEATLKTPAAILERGAARFAKGGARLLRTQHGSTNVLFGAALVLTTNAQAWNEGLELQFVREGVSGLKTEFLVPATAGREHQLEVRVLESPATVLDVLAHPFVLGAGTDSAGVLAAASGRFRFRGDPWRAHGVNYMPSTGMGLANGDYFEHWLGRGAYDPSVIQRDLERIKDMGLNAVSAFIYHRSLEAGHLFDFLRRCERLGLRVNLSLRPGTPMEFRWAEMEALIEHYRLASNTTVMAYDLAWEPSHYNEDHQRRFYTEPWNAWVLNRYSTVTNAEASWGQPVPRVSQAADEKLAVPSGQWLTQDGPWRRVVADYRQFLDELVGERYAEARRLVRTIDAEHLVSFRMQMSGDPTHNGAGLFPYDFKGLAQAVDIWEPEAYGRIGDWERVKAGRFTVDYARLCNPDLPVLWAEMGYDTWDRQAMATGAGKMTFAERYYRDFYRMLRESASDGVMFWWYPGGYRLNEQSDYGIINADGTDRPITRVIREEGPRFLAAPKPAPPDHWIEVDRDRDARGLFGIYQAVQESYWRAIGLGQTPGLLWKSQRPGQQPGTKVPASR